MRDEIDLSRVNSVDGFEEVLTAICHDDEPLRELVQFRHHQPLIRIRLGQDGVESCHHWHPNAAHELQQMAAGGAAVDAEFMLNRENFNVVDF